MKNRTSKIRTEEECCIKHRAEGFTQSSKGFTLIELLVAIIIVLILTSVLLTRVWFYQEQAEKAAMQQVASALQSALVMQYGQLLTTGMEADAKMLVTENPVYWLMQKPHNYSGEFQDVNPAAIVPGNWAYDLGTHEMVYVPYRTDYFIPGKDGKKWVRYRVRLEYAPARRAVPKADARKDSNVLTSLLFEPVEPYHWLIREEK
ncbi:MAG: type II secretion system protein [Gallionellaceae bacterium]|jgi:general secretion pathway protein G